MAIDIAPTLNGPLSDLTLKEENKRPAREKTKSVGILDVPRIDRATVIVHVVGVRPLILARMSEKARQELLSPRGRKTAADKQANLKHNPLEEYRASAYTLPDDAPTLLAIMSSAFKGAMATAALDLPDTKKAQIGRLVWVENDYTPIYGVPRLFMSITRSADINHTPDVRTRAIVPEWACRLEVGFVRPLLNEQSIFNLLYAAGITVGVGDWRPEKGKGTFGSFVVVAPDDPRYLAIQHYDREVQQAALDHPVAYDKDSADLYAWWTDDTGRRGFKVPS